MNGKLKIEIDTNNTKLVLGGIGIAKVLDGTELSGIRAIKVLGLYKEFVEGFDIDNKELIVIKNSDVVAGKITIDGYDIAKESYRVFVSNLDKKFNYEVTTYLTKPVAGEKADIMDMKLLNSYKFKNHTKRDVIIEKFDTTIKKYIAHLPDGTRVELRRYQFVIENNRLDIAFLLNINE